MIEHPVKFGQTFRQPSKRSLRLHRQQQQQLNGKRMFEASEFRLIIQEATYPMKAMVLLGINGGLGASDLSSLPHSVLDLSNAWLDYPRRKTGVERRISLWPETVEAIQASTKNRTDDHFVFITREGNQYARVLASGAIRNSIMEQFSELIKGGRIPTLHALTDEGSRLIELQAGERPERVLRSDPSPSTFQHRQQIVRVMRAFDLGCDAVDLDRLEWIMEQDIWPNAHPHTPPNQRRKLYHDLGNGLICQPDLACRFRIGKTELALFWEIDLSTEGKKQLRKAGKTDIYVALFNQRGYRRYWPDLPRISHWKNERNGRFLRK